MSRATALATVAAIALVAVAIVAGTGAARLRTGAVPSPSPAPISATPSPTVPPDTGPLVFGQPLTAGCVAGSGVYVVSDGGGIGRFDGDGWQLIDPTLRSLVAAACRGNVLIAIGGAGGVVTIDDAARSIRSDAVQLDDLLAISLLPDGALAAGRRGSVLRQTAAGWFPHARGLAEDLEAIAAFGSASAWVVGAGGVTYRLVEAGWRAEPSATSATLRAIAGTRVDDVVAVGDGGTILRYRNGWEPIAPVVPRVTLRAVTVVGGVTWIAGDRGTLLRLDAGDAIAAFDLGTACTLRAIFAQGETLWVIGSDATRAAVWRIAGGATRQWGSCP